LVLLLVPQGKDKAGGPITLHTITEMLSTHSGTITLTGFHPSVPEYV
jgi:hypothetical protein